MTEKSKDKIPSKPENPFNERYFGLSENFFFFNFDGHYFMRPRFIVGEFRVRHVFRDCQKVDWSTIRLYEPKKTKS